MPRLKYCSMFLLQAIGRYALSCSKIFYNYSKKNGHITASIDSSISCSFPNLAPIQQNSPTNIPILTPKMVQQMIILAFSTLGFSSKFSSRWYFNFGTFNHMTSNAQFLTNIKKYYGKLKIHTADRNQLSITTIGDNFSSLTNVFVSPSLMSNLVSVGQLDQHSRKIIVKEPKVEHLFPIHFLLSSSLSLPLVSCNYVIVDYQHVGYPNSNILHDMLKYGFLGNKHTSSLNVVHFDCISCKLEKSKILLFPTHNLNVTQPFDIIHSNVWRVSPIISHDNYKYFVTFIDYYSRFTWEYTSYSFKEFLQSNDTISQRSCLSTPQQNEVVEQKNHHLLDVVCTMLLESHVPSCFCCEALSTIVHLINRLSSPSLDNESPSLGYFVTHLITLLFVSLIVCVIFIFLHKNVPSSMDDLLNVFFLVILLIKTTFYIMILTFHAPLKIIPWLLLQYKNLNQLLHVATWDIVSCPPFVKHSRNKFMFFIKLHSDGSIDCYKAQLVVLRNKQEYGLDYDETFAPVAKMIIVCTIFALVASQSCPLCQIDVKNTLLHDDLKEEVYIKLPYGQLDGLSRSSVYQPHKRSGNENIFKMLGRYWSSRLVAW
ncbi:hypothetical protein CR513_47159, partial [Mucuna pruriens]